MKKIEIKGKLSLNKATIANLNDAQMAHLKGGAEGGGTVGCPQEKLWTLWKCHNHYPSCNHDSPCQASNDGNGCMSDPCLSNFGNC